MVQVIWEALVKQHGVPQVRFSNVATCFIEGPINCVVCFVLQPTVKPRVGSDASASSLDILSVSGPQFDLNTSRGSRSGGKKKLPPLKSKGKSKGTRKKGKAKAGSGKRRSSQSKLGKIAFQSSITSAASKATDASGSGAELMSKTLAPTRRRSNVSSGM